MRILLSQLSVFDFDWLDGKHTEKSLSLIKCVVLKLDFKSCFTYKVCKRHATIRVLNATKLSKERVNTSF